MNPLNKFLKTVDKVVKGTSSYTTGGFKVTIGELSKVLSASVEYVGSGNYLAQVITKDVDDTLADNEIKIFVRTNIEQTINEAGTATVTVGNEVAAGTDLSSELFVVHATGI